jgi:predicted nucleotidyltransferase
MRLTDFEALAIIHKAKEFFGENTRVYLFGSRVDDQKKGGDIDLYIVTDKTDDLLERKIKFLAALTQEIGEQKVDVIFAENPTRKIEQIAQKEGIELNEVHLRIQKVLSECDKHLQRLNDAYQDMQAFMLLSAESYQQLTKDQVQAIDQYLYRFTKLPDAMGGKLFKRVLSLYEENADRLSVIDMLNKLEKLQILPSAEDWRLLRQLRNALAHEYEDDPEKAAALINALYAKKQRIESIYWHIKNFLLDHHHLHP